MLKLSIHEFVAAAKKLAGALLDEGWDDLGDHGIGAAGALLIAFFRH